MDRMAFYRYTFALPLSLMHQGPKQALPAIEAMIKDIGKYLPEYPVLKVNVRGDPGVDVKALISKATSGFYTDTCPILAHGVYVLHTGCFVFGHIVFVFYTDIEGQDPNPDCQLYFVHPQRRYGSIGSIEDKTVLCKWFPTDVIDYDLSALGLLIQAKGSKRITCRDCYTVRKGYADVWSYVTRDMSLWAYQEGKLLLKEGDTRLDSLKSMSDDRYPSFMGKPNTAYFQVQGLSL